MDKDDVQIGKLLTRREMLVLLGGVGVAAAVGCTTGTSSKATPTTGAAASAPTAGAPAAATQAATAAATQPAPACIVVPALTQGPYFVDENLNRSDIRADTNSGTVRDGTPLALTFAVSQVNNGCTPLAGATVDVWHCDAAGVYSDSRDPGFNTIGQNFLRGAQTTDAQGRAAFVTIYPGWYQGRAVHIHFKIRTNPQGQTGTEFTSQLFFDDALSDQVFAGAPYAAKGSGRLLNSGDMIFRQSNGLLTLSPQRTGDGFAADFSIGLQV